MTTQDRQEVEAAVGAALQPLISRLAALEARLSKGPKLLTHRGSCGHSGPYLVTRGIKDPRSLPGTLCHLS